MKLSEHEKVVSLAIIAAEINFNATVVALEAIQKLKPTTTDYILKVNYNQSLKAMIKAGKYRWVNPNITKERFPVEDTSTGEKEVETKLFHFNRQISTEDAIAKMNKAGFRVAKPAELLKLGELYPNLQKKFLILALGQFWTCPRGGRHVLGLSCDGSKRELDLVCGVDGWADHCRFLGVHK